MKNEHQIVKSVYTAKDSSQAADNLIREYIPFILSEASKSMSRYCTEQDDEFSIAMFAFYEAIMGYERERGAFLSYASMLIRNRIIDYIRKEKRHGGVISLYTEAGDDERTIMDDLVDEQDYYEESATREATRQEIEELSALISEYGVSFSDVADNSPKQERTLEACAQAIRYGASDKELLQKLTRTKKLPMNELVQGCGIDRKTLERHRKYILVMLLLHTNGYEIIRGHLRRVLKGKGGNRE